MRINYNAAGSDDAVQFAKSVLQMFVNIREFEVFHPEQETPYVVVENGLKTVYSFVLRDDHGKELWLNTFCGYGGAGAAATLEILQLFGLKDDYRIYDRRYVKETELHPRHTLNVVVSTTPFGLKFQGRFWATMEFKLAHQLEAVKQMLQCLGVMGSAEGRGIAVPELLLKEQPKIEWPTYATNQTLMLHHQIHDLPDSRLESLIGMIVHQHGGSIGFLRVAEGLTLRVPSARCIDRAPS